MPGLRDERFYPHPVRRVWEALTTAQHLGVWMAARVHVDARLGGRFSLTFGATAVLRLTGTVRAFRPCEMIDYSFDAGGSLRFELRAVAGGTRLLTRASFPPGFMLPGSLGEFGEDLPGGLRRPSNPRIGDSGAFGEPPATADTAAMQRIDRAGHRIRGGVGRRCSRPSNRRGVRLGVRRSVVRHGGELHRARAAVDLAEVPVLLVSRGVRWG
jgi:uncharacterized protein YndB with AHSA1/START domain